MTTDRITRLNAALEGRYAIEREIGEGGMATVYLAHDERHNRNVALKVLKAELAAVVGAERFLAEIETTAKLTHPHILALYDSGEADGFLFFVGPYIEGDTLRDKIDREKQLGIEEALDITKKVASALDYAHERGVVHRDIKPGNILLSEKGEPTVADFGIALAVAQAGGDRVTETGLSVGTPHYMSPEQATGDRDVDPRTDVYALGSVLYEMLVGDPPYQGSTAQAVLAKILTDPAPAPTKVRLSIPPNVDAAIRKALEKLPADRFTAAQDFAGALGDSGFRHGEEVAARVAAAPRPWRRDRRSIAALAVAAAFAVLYIWEMSSGSSAVRPVSFRSGLTDFEVLAPAGTGNRVDISRDGSLIVAVSIGEQGVSKLFLRRADQLEFREIPGTEDAIYPSFSPDGQWIVFEVTAQLNRVEVSGGPVLPVTEGRRPHWGLDGRIYYDLLGELYHVSPSGGEPVLILDGDSLDAQRPFALPDGEAVLFQTGGDMSSNGVMLLEVASGVVTDLGITGNNPRYVPTGHLVYGHEDQALRGVPFDLATHRVTGEAATVLPGVLVFGGGATQFAVSETGTAVYGLTTLEPGALSRLVVVDLTDGETPLPVTGGVLWHPRFSSNGRQIAYQGDGGIFIYDRDTGENRPLGGPNSNFPWWSRDGRYVYFTQGGLRVSATGVRRLADGSEEAESLYQRVGRVCSALHVA